jgi:AraC-like DNA-binding protein
MPIKNDDIRYIRQAKTIITENFDKHITIPDLSKRVGINEAKLKEGFRELYGHSVHSYQQELRLEKARYLLTNTKMPIADITLHIGYSHVTHFSSLFKKKLGVTPSQWRKMHAQ